VPPERERCATEDERVHQTTPPKKRGDPWHRRREVRSKRRREKIDMTRSANNYYNFFNFFISNNTPINKGII
jgi:hypothetical protein